MKKPSLSLDEIKAVAARFQLPGPLVAIEHVATGHINESYIGTFSAAAGPARVLLQQLNSEVFPNPDTVMATMGRVLSHLRSLPNLPPALGEPMTLIRTKDGALYVRDETGNVWRTVTFFDDAESFDVCPGPAHARAVGEAFGSFLWALRALPPSEFPEPIPHFQDVSRRFSAFQAAVDGNPRSRRDEVADLVDYVHRHQAIAARFQSAIAEGRIPLRLTHADPKVNNVLFVRGAPRVKSVVDLDTVMPGTSLYDFGDMVRSATVRCREDETDLLKVEVDDVLAGELIQGFLSGIGDELTGAERDLLPIAPRVIAYTLGVRFLTDYLEGDRYFRIRYPEQNKNRARTQFAIADRLAAREADFRVICSA